MATSTAIKRILTEVQELHTISKSPSSLFTAAPLETDLFEWHFTVRGPPDTAFAGGLYHGRIVLPPEYPFKAPEIFMLTPNGRFEVDTRICLSFTSFHQETWQPSWGIRTMLTALVGYMPSKDPGLGSLDFPDYERRILAEKSKSFVCRICGAEPAKEFPGEAPTTTSKIDDSQSDQDVRRASSCYAAKVAHGISGESSCTPETSGNARKGADSQVELVKVSRESDSQSPEPEDVPRRNADNVKGIDSQDGIVSHDEGRGKRNETLADREMRRSNMICSKESGSVTANRRNDKSTTRERELLYLSYLVSAILIAIIARRLYITFL